MRDTRQQAQYEPQYEQRIKAVTEKIMKKKKKKKGWILSYLMML